MITRASSLALLFGVLACGGDDPTPPDCTTLAVCRDEGLCSHDGARCAAVSDADCSDRSEVCTTLGRCSAQGGRCVALDDTQCQASSWCAIYGGCHAKDGVCVALTDEDCQASSGCTQYGWCSVNFKGECVKVGGT